MSETKYTGTYSCIINVRMTPEFEGLTKQQKERAMYQIHQAIAEGNYDYIDGTTFPYRIDSITLGRKTNPTELECSIGFRIIRQVKQE